MILNDVGVFSRLFFTIKLKLRNIDKINMTPRASDPNIGTSRKEIRRMDSLRVIDFSIRRLLE